MKKIGFLFLIAFTVNLNAALVQEGYFIHDPLKKWVKHFKNHSDLTIDHLDELGFEVYGPFGLGIWLKEYKELVSLRNNIERQALEISVANGDDDWEGEVVGALHRLAKAPSGAQAVETHSVEEREKRHRSFHVAP